MEGLRRTSLCCKPFFPGSGSGSAEIFVRSLAALIVILAHAGGRDVYHSACEQRLSHPPHNQLAAKVKTYINQAREASWMNHTPYVGVPAVCHVQQ
jgi:hypothetical protein